MEFKVKRSVVTLSEISGYQSFLEKFRVNSKIIFEAFRKGQAQMIESKTPFILIDYERKMGGWGLLCYSPYSKTIQRRFWCHGEQGLGNRKPVSVSMDEAQQYIAQFPKIQAINCQTGEKITSRTLY